MRTLLVLFLDLVTCVAKLLGPGGTKALIAESLLVKHQFLIIQRSCGTKPSLTTLDRFLCGFLSLFMHPQRIRKAAVIIKPATVTKFRRALSSRNYHQLFSSRRNVKPGPKGPSDELVRLIVEMKQRNPHFGCPRIAQQISKTFAIEIIAKMIKHGLCVDRIPEHEGIDHQAQGTELFLLPFAIWSPPSHWLKGLNRSP